MPRMRAPTSTRGPWLAAARRGAGRRQRPCRPLEQAEQPIRNEARARGIDVAVALRILAVGEEALRHHEMQIVLGARHRDVEQAALLLDLGGRAGAEVGRNAAVDDVEHEDRLPFLALGGMDGREDQIVLVEQRHAGLVAGRVRRIERQFGEEALARRIAAGDLLELDQVGAARLGVLVDALEMRLVPQPRALELGRPPARRAESPIGLRRRPSSRRRRAAAPERWQAPRSDRRPPPCGRARAAPTPARRPAAAAARRKPATRSRGFSTKRSSASMSLTCAASRNFRPPNLTNGMLRRVSSTSSGPLWLRGAEQHRLLLQQRAVLAVLQHALDDVARLVGLVAHA